MVEFEYTPRQEAKNQLEELLELKLLDIDHAETMLKKYQAMITFLETYVTYLGCLEDSHFFDEYSKRRFNFTKWGGGLR